VAEEPEDVLEHHRVAAAGRAEEAGAEEVSVSSIVTAPASTGITAISRKAVISQVQTEQRHLQQVMPGARMFMIVAMMLIAPMID
jgi:hypothetical protein